MTRRLDRLNPANSKGTAFVHLWQRNCEIAEANDADLQDQITALANLNSDDVLTPAKKPIWIFMHSFLTGEQAALDAEATTYGITTEKTAYDNAISALNTHLATLTTAVDWDDLSGNTTIVGTTFRSKFNDVMTAKQALLNKMHDSAKGLADAAQADADTVTLNDAISASWTSPGTILTGEDAGTDARITITSHTRKYGDNTQLAGITGGPITGLAYSTKYYVYYDDSTRSDTTPTFQATTNPNTAKANAAAGRHECGSVTTPASGGGSTSGGYTPPGGYSGPGEIP